LGLFEEQFFASEAVEVQAETQEQQEQLEEEPTANPFFD